MIGSSEQDFSIVAVDKFIQATRDSGYKGTSSAVAELVDNSLQAGATAIHVRITASEDEEHPIVLKVIDDGSGMDSRTLRTALRFGGSTRFNDRVGLGRYGMGLPNSSLSQAQRVTVHTWGPERSDVLRSYLDLDEIAAGVMNASTLDRPVLVLDSHHRRILQRMGLVPRSADTKRAYDAIMPAMPPGVPPSPPPWPAVPLIGSFSEPPEFAPIPPSAGSSDPASVSPPCVLIASSRETTVTSGRPSGVAGMQYGVPFGSTAHWEPLGQNDAFSRQLSVDAALSSHPQRQIKNTNKNDSNIVRSILISTPPDNEDSSFYID